LWYFEDLQLGPFGEIQGCGCLYAKYFEVVENANLTNRERTVLADEMDKALGDNDIYSVECPNTRANRRKAYNALVRATKKALKVDIV